MPHQIAWKTGNTTMMVDHMRSRVICKAHARLRRYANHAREAEGIRAGLKPAAPTRSIRHSAPRRGAGSLPVVKC